MRQSQWRSADRRSSGTFEVVMLILSFFRIASNSDRAALDAEEKVLCRAQQEIEVKALERDLALLSHQHANNKTIASEQRNITINTRAGESLAHLRYTRVSKNTITQMKSNYDWYAHTESSCMLPNELIAR